MFLWNIKGCLREGIENKGSFLDGVRILGLFFKNKEIF